MKLSSGKTFFFISSFLISLTSLAQKNTISLSTTSANSNTITKDLEVLVDPSGMLEFNDVLRDSGTLFHTANAIGKPTNKVYWARVNIVSEDRRDLVWRIGAVWWDYVTAYLIYPDSSLITLNAGLLRKKSDKQGKDFATFTLPAGKEIKLYVRLSSSGYFMRMDNVNINLTKHENALEDERYRLYLSAIIIGILTAFAFYNLAFFASSKERSYIWYFLYMMLFAISFSGQLGLNPSYLTQFFLPEHPAAGLFMKRLSDPLMFTFLILFSISFLHTKEKSKVLHKLLLFTVLILFVHFIIWITGLYNRNLGNAYIGQSLYLLAVAVCIYAGVAAYRGGFHAARFFIAGQILIGIGITIGLFITSGWGDPLWFLPDTRFLNFVRGSHVFFFAALQALVFSMALGDRQKVRLQTLVAERTEELNTSFNTLRATQKQLIQSEKMASLGELTAGIAHEIQNPLNFVNNFSEVNTELFDELQQELRAGKISDAIAIMNNIKENEEKINHHGRRADAIVKGMLQHSRTKAGMKEPANINRLADEYSRLAYHGLRAKDKSFNATLNTNFDESIADIKIIPQDMGRVFLNLLNNAFYAVDEKKRQIGNPYMPTVSISTIKVNGSVEIRIADNGDGIPQRVMDKIFQPFFSTKPTGQGTGLGLSLAYDIVTAHGGELKVETKEGEGSTFVIQLPMS